MTPDGFVVNTSRSIYLHAPSDTDQYRLVPPQTMPHIGDRLDAKGVSWKWYSGGYDDAAAGHPDKLFQFHHQVLHISKTSRPAHRRSARTCKTIRTFSGTSSGIPCRRWCSTSRSVS